MMTVSLGTVTAENLDFQFLPLPTNRRQCENFQSRDSRFRIFSMSEPLSDQQLSLIDAYWRASTYLTVGQIYLMANPLLREPLRPEHIKPRLLGHWGTSPGQNFIYAHLNRLIRENDANVIYISG